MVETQHHDQLSTRAHDGLDQILTLKRGQFDVDHNIVPGTENFNEAWAYDSIGNWSNYEQGDPDPVLTQGREHNLVNELTWFDMETDRWVRPRYDKVGNTAKLGGGEDPLQTYRIDYDAWNRACRIFTFDAEWARRRVAVYTYDGRGYRIQERIYDPQPGIDPEEEKPGRLIETYDDYYDDRWRLIERDVTPAPIMDDEGELVEAFPQRLNERYVWNQMGYIDKLIHRQRDTTGDGILDGRLVALQGLNYNMSALIDNSTGNVVERYTYIAFGEIQYLTPDFTPQSRLRL